MIQNLPKDIKENGRFCLWRYEEQNGRRTKVPYQVNGKRASSKSIRAYVNALNKIANEENFQNR